MSREIEQLEYIINGAETRRFHTRSVLREQSVGLHSFGVAWLSFWLMGGHARPHLLLAALAHDLPEHKFGDMPAPTKRSLGEQIGMDVGAFRKHYDAMEAESADKVELDFEQYLTDNERRVLKLADAAEGALYCIRERRMGNQTIEVPYRNFRSYIMEVIEAGNPREAALSIYLVDMWSQANG